MNSNNKIEKIASSFRDPSGFIFSTGGTIFRQVNWVYKENFDHLISSGLYSALVNNKLLLPHEETEIAPAGPDGYRVIRPRQLGFISYPYEWCFSQLKDAALTTIQIQKTAMEFGMSLKDASAYNIQFNNLRPVLIDTLSFEKYHAEKPWIAYRQFCQHFLAPLALMSYTDARLNQLLRVHIDGIPLDIASRMLPFRSRFAPAVSLHIHIHAQSQRVFHNKDVAKSGYKMSRVKLLSLIDSLESAVKSFKVRTGEAQWDSYYADCNYSQEAFAHKKQKVSEFMDMVKPECVWDFGANTGVFSRIASEKGIRTIAFDMDHHAVERHYHECLKNGLDNVLPLIMDITNPSPAIGWKNRERAPLAERGPVDMALALALVHHLAFSHNLPLGDIAGFSSSLCRFLIIEFVPKTDSQVKSMLRNRPDIFPYYDQENFEKEFSKYFTIRASLRIEDSERTLYLMEKKR